MKKSLIALSVLAASGAAMAQSSVTMYGRLDASLAQVTTETTSSIAASRVAEVKQTGINTNNLNTTFWGLRGSEDLGGGLRATFGLESGFNMDTGALTGDMFARKAVVGLAGGFGSVDLGRQLTSYDVIRGATNHNFDSNFAVVGDVWATGVADYSSRQSNQIVYNSPVFSGFSGGVGYSFGENKTATTAATNGASAHLKYANGPLFVGYGYQEEEFLVAGAENKRKYNLFGATYNLGFAKLVGSYNTAKNNTLKDQEYQVGVDVPFGAAAIYAGYARSKSEGAVAAGGNNVGKGFSAVGTYSLSKRTTLYAGFETTKIQTANGATEAKRSNIASGVRHLF